MGGGGQGGGARVLAALVGAQRRERHPVRRGDADRGRPAHPHDGDGLGDLLGIPQPQHSLLLGQPGLVHDAERVAVPFHGPGRGPRVGARRS